MGSGVVGMERQSFDGDVYCHEMSQYEHEKHYSINDNHNQSIQVMNYSWQIPDNVYKNAIQLEYTTNPLNPENIDLSLDVNNDNNNVKNCQMKLNELEKNRLEEINQHFRHLYEIGDNLENKKVITDIEDGFKYFEVAMKKLIITVKNIPSLKKMCQEDQILLLKASAGEIKTIMNLRFFNPSIMSCYLPNPSERNSFLVFDEDYLRKTYGDELMSRCKNLFLSFRDDWRNDDSILNLMAMILLFYPNKPNLLHREYIMYERLEYFTYCHLLQRYLQVKYSSICEAKTIFLNLLSRLEEIHYLNERCMELILKLDPKYIGPLTVELYDLKYKKVKTS